MNIPENFESSIGIPKGFTTKTNGNGEEILIPDPDYFNYEGQTIKNRKKYPSNLTPKKKKRRR